MSIVDNRCFFGENLFPTLLAKGLANMYERYGVPQRKGRA